MPHAPAQSSGVIVYLTQLRHSSYGRNSLELLKQSVNLLYRHYNSAHQDDVLFFHTGDFPLTAQQEVLALCLNSRARFYELPKHHFEVPPGTPPMQSWRYIAKFSAGYRHMIRFFTSGLWQVVANEGYAYVMRMDEDSFIWSPIRENLFTRMQRHGYEYGYRLAVLERDGQVQRFHSFVRNYALRNAIAPTWLLQACKDKSIANYTLRNCGDSYNIYNNWFISKVSFWLQPSVQRFLAHVNRSHAIYSERWGDLLWQSAALQLFMDHEQVHMFTDFAYEHATFSPVPFPAAPTWQLSRLQGLNRTCLAYGGITIGDADGQAAARARLRELASTPLCRHYHHGRNVMRPCVIYAEVNGTRIVSSYLLGSVSTVQHRCDRQPAPSFCTGNHPSAPAMRTSTSHQDRGWQRMQAALGGVCCCHNARTSKFIGAIAATLGVPVRGVSLDVPRTRKKDWNPPSR